jgi:hypothetical protein
MNEKNKSIYNIYIHNTSTYTEKDFALKVLVFDAKQDSSGMFWMFCGTYLHLETPA